MAALGQKEYTSLIINISSYRMERRDAAVESAVDSRRVHVRRTTERVDGNDGGLWGRGVMSRSESLHVWYVEFERVVDGRTICGVVKDVGCQSGGVKVNHECNMSTGTALQTDKPGACELG